MTAWMVFFIFWLTVSKSKCWSQNWYWIPSLRSLSNSAALFCFRQKLRSWENRDKDPQRIGVTCNAVGIPRFAAMSRCQIANLRDRTCYLRLGFPLLNPGPWRIASGITSERRTKLLWRKGLSWRLSRARLSKPRCMSFASWSFCGRFTWIRFLFATKLWGTLLLHILSCKRSKSALQEFNVAHTREPQLCPGYIHVQLQHTILWTMLPWWRETRFCTPSLCLNSAVLGW